MTKRKYGIDLLRIISMFLIVMLHILIRGGLLKNTAPGSANYHAAWLMEIIAMCAVNCYGLISGYVNVDNKIKYHKLCVMWLQVVFYCFFITLIYFFSFANHFRYYYWTNPFFPVCTGQYWYFTAYFVLFLFMPFLNIMINNLNRIQLKAIAVIIFIVFSIAPTVWQGDMFVTKNGYSFLWLALLYIAGAVIKKLDLANKLRIRQWALIFIGCIAITYIFKISAASTNAAVNEDLLTFYPSPTTVIAAFSLFSISVKLKIKKKGAVKLIKFFAPLSFSVYLIHTNIWIWNYIIKDCAVSLASFSTPLMVLSIIGLAFSIYLACSLIDYLRLLLFKALKITPALAKAEKNTKKIIYNKKHNN